MDNSTSNVASISIGDLFNKGMKAIEMMHIVAASTAHKNKHAGGPVCKASSDGGYLPTKGSTLRVLYPLSAASPPSTSLLHLAL